MKKTLLICTVVFLGLSASAQVKKEAVQNLQPLTSTTSEVPTDRATDAKIRAEKLENLRVAEKLKAMNAADRRSKAKKSN